MSSTIDFVINILLKLNSIYLISALGALIGYPLVKLGPKWGKVPWGKKFKSVPVLFLAFVASLMLVGIWFEVFTPMLSILLQRVVQWKVFVDSIVSLTLYVWFSHSFKFDIRWWIVAIFVLGMIINVGYLYATGAFPILVR